MWDWDGGRQFKKLIKIQIYSRKCFPAHGHTWQAPGQWGHQEYEEKSAERLGGQRETKLPKRCPSATWHRPAQCQGAQQEQGSDTASAPTTLHFTPALTRKEEQSVRHCWTGDLVQTQTGHFPPLTPSKATSSGSPRNSFHFVCKSGLHFWLFKHIMTVISLSLLRLGWG